MFGQGDGLIEEKALAVAGTAEAERLTGLLEYEKQLWQGGVELAAGLDEVGRGPIAGPVVTAAVIWRPGCCWPGLMILKSFPPKSVTHWSR